MDGAVISCPVGSNSSGVMFWWVREPVQRPSRKARGGGFEPPLGRTNRFSDRFQFRFSDRRCYQAEPSPLGTLYHYPFLLVGGSRHSIGKGGRRPILLREMER